jgi:hypothetical protein
MMSKVCDAYVVLLDGEGNEASERVPGAIWHVGSDIRFRPDDPSSGGSVSFTMTGPSVVSMSLVAEDGSALWLAPDHERRAVAAGDTVTREFRWTLRPDWTA